MDRTYATNLDTIAFADALPTSPDLRGDETISEVCEAFLGHMKWMNQMFEERRLQIQVEHLQWESDHPWRIRWSRLIRNVNDHQ